MTDYDENDQHQRIIIKMIGYLEGVVGEGELRATPSIVYLDSRNRVRPDLFWISETSTRCTLDERGFWVGVPDIVVEIVSPLTEAIDRSEKYMMYEKARVYEYWLVNPLSEFIEVFVLLNRRFIRHGLFQPGERFNSGALNGRSVEVVELLNGDWSRED